MFSMSSYARVPDGTVMTMGIRYPAMGDGTKVFTYALLKAGGAWYTTGTGQVPQQASWQAVDRWLTKHNRVIEWVKIFTQSAQIYPAITTEAPSPA